MKKINYLDSIKSPVITEKATGLSEQNKVIFKVHENATKSSIGPADISRHNQTTKN